MKTFLGRQLRNCIRYWVRWSAPIIAEELKEYRLDQLRKRLGAQDKEFFAQWPVTVSGRVQIGNCVSMASYVHIWGDAEVTIGNGVMIGSHTAIVSIGHDIEAVKMWKTEKSAPVIIEDNVWIGAHCVILPGVTIGQGAAVGAGSVVTRDVLPNQIVGGIPARVLRARMADLSKTEC